MSKTYLGQTKVIEVDGEKVTLGSYSYAIQKQITKLAQDDSLGAIDTFLENTIKEWSLTDDKGEKLSINRVTLDTLAGSFVQKILQEAITFNNLNPAEIKN